jgi:hypothetical protein
VPMIVIGGWENHVGGHLREAPSRVPPMRNVI